MSSENIGDIMSEGRNRALKALAIFAGILVYLGMIVYSGIHNYSLMTAGVPPDLLIWAVVGVIALEITAVALPIALHWWTHSALQRFATFGFYFLDLALIFLNVVLDFALNAGNTTPAWMQYYLYYGVPATPVIAGVGWSILFLLDPSQRERGMVEGLRASTREALATRIALAARSADIDEMVEHAAQHMAFDIVQATLGAPVSRRVIPGTARSVPEPVLPETPEPAQAPFVSRPTSPQEPAITMTNGTHPNGKDHA